MADTSTVIDTSSIGTLTFFSVKSTIHTYRTEILKKISFWWRGGRKSGTLSRPGNVTL